MRSITRRLVAGIATLGVVLVATACGPQPGISLPTNPPPSGGRVLVNGPQTYRLEIVDATGDLSLVVYLQHQWTGAPDPINGRYHLYDDRTRLDTLLPVREGEFSTVRLLPDERRIVFSSNDPALQVGPVAQNCWRHNGFFQPLTHTYCAELYLYDLVDGSLRQLTGLGGSSSLHNSPLTASADGATLEYVASNPIPEGGGPTDYHRIDLVTGVSVDVPAPGCCSWVRGNRRILFDRDQLTSEDLGTGVVTTLGGEGSRALESATDDGHFVVLWNFDDSKLHVIDTDTGADVQTPSKWVGDDGARYLVIQLNPFPNNSDRLVTGPVRW